MQLLFSPILWLGLAVFYVFARSGNNDKGTDLSVFKIPETAVNGSKTVTTSNGSKIKGANITIGRANSLAGQLWEKFDEYFTSETDILDLLSGLNESDFILVFDQFGKHKMDLVAKTGSYLLGSDYNLIEWINKELKSKNSRIALNKQFPNIF